MKLIDLIDIHKGEDAWLFGKGPSLDYFNFDDAGPIRAGVNHTVTVIPDCIYGFASDVLTGDRSFYNRMSKPFTLFNPDRCYCKRESTKVDCDMVTYHDSHADERFAQSGEAIAREGLAMTKGTITAALQIFKIMGISRIHCIGIDGGGELAKRGDWPKGYKSERAAMYNRIRSEFISRSDEMNMPLVFHTHKHTTTTGKMRLEIIKNTIASGVAYDIGDRPDLSERDAAILISMGKAQRIAEVVTEIKETATPQNKIETPELPATKPRRKPANKRGK